MIAFIKKILAKSDKVLHFTVSMLVMMFFTIGLKHLGYFPCWAVITLAGLISLLIGVCKEIYDLKHEGNYAEWGDLLADFLGIVTVAGYTILLTIG